MSETDDKKKKEIAEEVRNGIKKVIAEHKKTDPLAGPKLGSVEVYNWILKVLKNERGVHFESFISLLGSLGGYSCQVCVREQMGVPEKTPENKAFVIVEGKDGTRYFFGDAINKPLAESQYSIWSLTAGALKHLGKEPINIREIFEHVSKTVGSGGFGIPRIPSNHSPSAHPIKFLSDAWPHVYPFAKDFCETPEELPMLFGMAIQKAILDGKDVIDPVLAATIAIESAIPMSKVELKLP